jgi:hypothetical protein
MLTALISMRFYKSAARLDNTKPFGGAVPAWVSFAFLIALGDVVYGLYEILISN